jgi:hypothetical protein
MITDLSTPEERARAVPGVYLDDDGREVKCKFYTPEDGANISRRFNVMMNAHMNKQLAEMVCERALR